MRSTVFVFFLFAARALFSVRPFCATPVKERNHIFHPFPLGEIVLIKRQLVVIINILQQIIHIWVMLRIPQM
jgi:hypothetical protein